MTKYMKKDLNCLNFVQSLAAFNENYFRFLIAYYLIALQGDLKTSEIMASTGAIFVIPFLLFSTLGGLFADKYSKTLMIQVTRGMEFFITLLTFGAFYLESEKGLFFLLFLMASTCAIFSPSKYGIIPELFFKERLLYALSRVSSLAYLGIILGSVFASLFLELSHFHYMIALGVSVIVALISFLASYKLPHLPPANSHKKLSLFIYQELLISIMEMKRIPKLFPVILAYGYIFFIAGYTNLNIVPFAINVLHLRYIDGGYLFLAAALGISVGSYFSQKITRELLDLLYIPKAGLLLSLAIFLMGILPASVWLTLVLLAISGFFAGLIIVYSSAFILKSSPIETRGRNFSTANFFSFLFILLASGFLGFFNVELRIDSSYSFAIIAVLNGFFMLYFLKAFKRHKVAKL